MIGDITHNHPCMRRSNTWRDLKPEHQVLTPMKGLPNVTPLATDGVIFYGLSTDGSDFVGHIENLDREIVKWYAPRKAPTIKDVVARKPKIKKEIADISDWL